MPETQASSPDRAVMPDLMRAFALLGIAVVNVVGFSQPFATGFHGGGLEGPADRIAYGGMAWLFLMKSYPLFSMMFGAGLSYQLLAADRAGKAFTPRYFRRMAALAVFGVLHFVFFWYGDILLTYALLGCLLFAIRDASVSALVRTGIILIVLNSLLLLALGGLIWLAETHAPETMSAAAYEQMDAAATAAFHDNSFWTAAAYRASLFPTILPSVIFQQGLSVFGFFCLGLAMVKAGVIEQPGAPLWRTARSVFLPVGLAGSALGAWMLVDADSSVGSQFLLGSGVIMAFSAFSALGYAGLIALASSGSGGPLLRFFARAGSASLTAYLLQSLVFGLIFTGYGLDQFGTMSASKAILCAAAVGLFSLIFTGIWRGFVERGPMEVVLRRITYWGRE